MTTTLSEGVKVPDVGSVNWAGDLEVNWNLLNGALANLSGNVKTDRDNVWTGEQSFTLPIVGSITGTAAKAIADEDGTSIKTGYVNVAGNQTVSGQKTWSGNQFFTSPMYPKNTSYEVGNTPASNVAIPIYFTDKNNAYTGYVRNVILATGRTQSELYARNKFTSGALSPTGTDVSSTLQVEVQSNGDKTLYFDGSIRNNVLPYATNTYSLGSSSYQWSSVYAQSYYYNGTAWGLDKANIWSQNQSVINAVTPKFILQDTRNDRTYSASATLSGGVMRWECDDKDGAPLSRISTTLRGDKVVQLQFAIFNEDSGGTEFDRTIRFAVGNTGSAVYYPEQTGNVDLGDSSHKWKTLNGINPGALSLPSSSYVEIDTTNWDLTGADNSYTPPADGYIFCGSSTGTDVKIFDFTTALGSTSHSSTIQPNYVYLPVRKNDNCIVGFIGSAPPVARFYPCLGNV